MINAILGKKISQTQRFTEDGKCLPVTLIEAGPCPVVHVKTQEKNGYSAIQLGFGQKKPKRVTKAIAGHIRGAKLKIAPRFLREIRIRNSAFAEASADKQELGLAPRLGPRGIRNQFGVGNTIKAGDIFKGGDKIAVTGTSKGKGFAGVVKRWGFAGGPRTHGQSDRERAPGSIGSTTTPGRVYKGKKMAGRMGQEKVTIKGVKVLEVDSEKNLLVVSGVVPGSRGDLLLIQKE